MSSVISVAVRLISVLVLFWFIALWSYWILFQTGQEGVQF